MLPSKVFAIVHVLKLLMLQLGSSVNRPKIVIVLLSDTFIYLSNTELDYSVLDTCKTCIALFTMSKIVHAVDKEEQIYKCIN